MDYTLVLGLLVLLIVGFFGYQWMSKLQVKKAPGKKAAMVSGPVVEEKYPEIDGQTTEEAKTKEPNQRREPSSQQQPVDNAGNAPAQFDQHLRHPEQAFHQEGQQHGNPPSQSNAAQNDGPVLGTPLFAFNGMEMMDSGSGLPPF